MFYIWGVGSRVSAFLLGRGPGFKCVLESVSVVSVVSDTRDVFCWVTCDFGET